ncbi:MAG TPA: type II secretion system protein, partial [Acidobacteriaceae bacterium]|nr:type II secretion system protein [Acidobacteriaceae bacterium]
MIHTQNHGIGSARARSGEQGYLLLGLLFLFVIILIGLALAAPKMAKEIQREKEVETVHRAEQYKRAIQLYYRKFGAYPTSISQLKETNQVRFLRQDYIDPMTGKKDWKLLHLGQVQMTTLGFFGQLMQNGGAMPVAGMQGTNGAATGISGAGGTT